MFAVKENLMSGPEGKPTITLKENLLILYEIGRLCLTGFRFLTNDI